MFQNFGRNFSTMPVSLSEWRVRIGTFVPRVLLSRYMYLDLTMKLFLALLNALADGENKMDPSEKETSPTTTDHQSSSDKAPSNPKKDDTPSGVSSDEQKTPTATADQTKDRVSKGSKKRKRHNLKGRCGPDQSFAFLSFRCFLKSGASPLLRFLLLVFTTILLIRSGDVEVNPGPNEGSTSVSDSTLLDIAKRIPQEKLYDLGNNLGIDFSSLRRYRATNTMGGAANWNGTLDMLIDWRDNTPIQQQEELLRNALISSSLHAVAEQYLPQGSLEHERSTDKQEVDGSTSMATGSSTPHQSKTSHPDIKPITREQLLKCREEIQSFYRVNLCQIPTSPLDSDSIVELQSIFTNLYLLKEDRNTKKKIPLKYEDLLTVDINGEPAKRIMIQGEAGVGKTTFCAKIAWDWVTGERYKDYTLVAVVPLREAKSGRTVGQVLKSYLSDDNDVTSKQLDDYIRTNQDKVLLIFDGFDEFDEEMENGGNQIVQILKGDKHTSGRIIVTTRPWKADSVADAMILKKQYAFVKIEGFKQKEVKTYVKKFYQDDKTSAQTLLEFMEEGSLVTEAMAPFPIFCSMLCHMWKEVERREVIRKLQTFSQLFQEMIIQLEEHYISKQATAFDPGPHKACGIKEKIDHHLKRISEIAFNGLLNNKLAFLEQEFESCADDLLVAYGVGILTREKTMCKREHGAVRKVARVDFTCSFPHKLFQEYTAAKHLQNLFNSNPDEFREIMQQTILPKAAEFKYLLYFTASFNDKLAKDVLTRLIDRKVHTGTHSYISTRQRERNQRVQMDLIVEVAFEGHSEEAASVIEEKCQDMHRSLTIEKDTSLHAIASYMFVLKQLESLCIKRMPQSKILSRNLAEKVCSLKTLKELQLEGCNITVSFSEILLQHSEEILVETFILQAVKLTKSSSINIAKCICFLSHLKNFKLSTESSMEDFLATLHSQASQSKITSLALEMCISESESPISVASLCALPCLKDFKLVCKNLSDEIFCALREKATSLKIESLDLSVGGITQLGSQSLAASICSMPCLRSVGVYSYSDDTGELKATLLKDVHIGESSPPSWSSSSGVISSTCQINIKMNVELLTAFVFSLVPSKTSKIESLDLSVGGISELGLQSLADSICSMPCLRSVRVHVRSSSSDQGALGKATLMKDVHKDESSPPLPLPLSSSSSSRVIPSTCQVNIEMDVELLIAFVSFLVPSKTAKVESLEIVCRDDQYRLSKSASESLGVSICSMPCLKNLKLAMKLSDEFFTTLRKEASSLKVESLEIVCRDDQYRLSKSASESLGFSICTMPCLKNLKLAMKLSDVFYTTLRKEASSLKIEQMHFKGLRLERSDSLAAFALMQNLESLTLFDVRISKNSKHTEEEGRHPSDTLSSTSLTELNVDHDSFISLCGMGLLKRFPLIQKMTLFFHDDQTPFPQEFLHHVTMPAIMDLTLQGYDENICASLTSLSLAPFPNLINLSLINICIDNYHCKAILESLRNEKTLKTISIKDCDTDADLDPLCNEINAEGKMTVTVQHGYPLIREIPDYITLILNCSKKDVGYALADVFRNIKN